MSRRPRLGDRGPLLRLLGALGLGALVLLAGVGASGAAASGAAVSGAAVSGAAGPGPELPGRVVTVGTEGVYPPFTFRDPGTGELTGFDVDVVQAVAEEAGWELRFVEAPFDSLFPALDSGRVDLLANQVTINPERAARYRFSTPYTYSRGVIVTAAETDDITGLADLEGRTAAQTSSSNWAEVAREAGARVQYVQDFGPGVELLAQGRVDAIVNDNIAVLDYLATSGNEAVKIAGPAGDEVLEQALVFRRGDADLQREADEALATLTADGTLAEISEGYFGADVTVEEGSGDVTVEGSDARSRWEVVQDTAWPMLRGMLQGTLPLTVVSFAAGLALALVTALGRISGVRPLEWLARGYVSVIRGTPLLVQLFLVFYGLGQVGIKLDPYVAAGIAFTLNVGGYAAEIIRGAILAVPRGQYEAAAVIGMSSRQTMRRVVLPQASRIAVPPLSNTLLSLVKDTSLASLVLVPELFREAQVAAALSTEYLPLYALAALYYWIVCYAVSLVQGPLERRLGRYVA